MYFLTDEVTEITPNNAQISIKIYKKSWKISENTKPSKPGF